jgi:hypothetical protein
MLIALCEIVAEAEKPVETLLKVAIKSGFPALEAPLIHALIL